MSDQARQSRSHEDCDDDTFEDAHAMPPDATRARRAALQALERELSEFLGDATR